MQIEVERDDSGMQLKEIAQKNNILTERSVIQAERPVAKIDPLEKQQNLTYWRFGRILQGLHLNEQRMKLLSELMFLVVSASLKAAQIKKAAKLKYAITMGASNATKQQKKRTR